MEHCSQETSVLWVEVSHVIGLGSPEVDGATSGGAVKKTNHVEALGCAVELR